MNTNPTTTPDELAAGFAGLLTDAAMACLRHQVTQGAEPVREAERYWLGTAAAAAGLLLHDRGDDTNAPTDLTPAAWAPTEGVEHPLLRFLAPLGVLMSAVGVGWTDHAELIDEACLLLVQQIGTRAAWDRACGAVLNPPDA